MRVSACVISLNEEDRIERCLESLSFCDERFVLDSGSKDRTVERARAMGARVEHQDFLGHRRQKQRAAELAEHDWILSLDCDEALSPELRSELVALVGAEPSPDVCGFSMPRKNRYLGRVMRHGMFWPDRKLRLFDRRRARWGGTDPHDRVEVREGRVVLLTHPILHDSYRSFDEHRATVDRFAAIAARAMHEEGRNASLLSPWLRGGAAFVKGAILKGGVLDGWRGLVAAFMSARYDKAKYSMLRRLGHEPSSH
ncbi:MAG: glycosyltransferase family 2 protein [Planctomycetes bacterium]|nr:glycosyltransferase family 2 protein [Planctomycetota bacterium]